MNAEAEDLFRAHAAKEYPRECCGLFVVMDGEEHYVPCRNLADRQGSQFVIDPQDYAACEDMGEIIGVGHSHPVVSPQPSEADRVQCEASGMAWRIVHVYEENGEIVTGEIVTFTPEGYEAPLVGRQFHHGVLDCFTLIRDWYKRERGIELPNFHREDDWWKKGQSLYLDNFEKAGFVRATGGIEVGDVILMQIRANTPNHGAVYIGDGLILQHLINRLSTRDVYDGYFQEVTRMVVRYKGNANG